MKCVKTVVCDDRKNFQKPMSLLELNGIEFWFGMVILPKPEKFKNNVPHRELVNLERFMGVSFRNSRL